MVQRGHGHILLSLTLVLAYTAPLFLPSSNVALCWVVIVIISVCH